MDNCVDIRVILEYAISKRMEELGEELHEELGKHTTSESFRLKSLNDFADLIVLVNQAAQGLVLAVVVFVVADWLGHVGLGLSLMLSGVMVAYSAILLVFRRSNTVETLAQPTRDERTFSIHLRASAASLNVVCVFAIGAFFVDLAHGNSTVTPWVAVSAVAGLSYLLAAIFFSLRG